MVTPKNIISVFFETAAQRGGAVCVRFKTGAGWRAFTWVEFADRVLTAAVKLKKMGLKHGDRVVIFSKTRLEWTLMDLAVLSVGGITVPVYSSLPAKRVAEIIANAEPSFAFVEDGNLGRVFDEAAVIARVACRPAALVDFFGTLPPASAEDKTAVRKIADDLGGSDVATIVYTSGTTGVQKGVVITHGNIMAEISALRKNFDIPPAEVGLLCLPLAHVLGRLMQFYHLAQGCETAYAEGVEKLAQNYLEIKPHFVCGIPRMLEKIHELVIARVAKTNCFGRAIFKMALAIGTHRSLCIENHCPLPFHLRLSFAIADKLVFSRIRTALGGRLNLFICGGAPLGRDIARFFHAAGILVIEGYGLTETFAAATVNRLDNFRFGTVGMPVDGVEMRIAADGEILFRGPTVFKEYLGLPEETAASFDRDGWFLTGDIGEMTPDNFLRITGRKKEMIITSGGKNIAPEMIEALMSASPFVSSFMVYGDGRKYLTGLVAINEEAAKEYLKSRGMGENEVRTPANHPVIKEIIAKHIEDRNKKLAPFETIKKFAIVDTEFSVASGELTPTLKVRRKFVEEKYKEIIEEMYAEKGL